MNMEDWNVTYTRNGERRVFQHSWAGAPTREHAAQALRNALFPEGLISDTHRDESEKTVTQLRGAGIEIVAVDPTPEA